MHFHSIGRSRDLPDELKGTQIFTMINVTEADALPREEIKNFCEMLKVRALQI